MTPEEAKALVAGPLGQEMAKFPLRFCKPVYFGPPPSRKDPVVVKSGTASLLKFRGKFLALTCSHVLAGYRSDMARNRGCIFPIANCYLNRPLNQLAAEDSAIDAAVLELTDEQACEITRGNNGIGEAFYEVGSETSMPIRVGDFVAYAGFPGCLRKLESFDELNFGSYSSGACRVIDVHSDYVVCGFEREVWIKHFSEPEPRALEGLSGGPVFVLRHRFSGVMSYEFAGIVFGMSASDEALFVRQAAALPLRWM